MAHGPYYPQTPDMVAQPAKPPLVTFKDAIDYLLDEFNLGDNAYDVREHADPSGRVDASSWDHPDVPRFSEAFELIVAWRKENSTANVEPVIAEIRAALKQPAIGTVDEWWRTRVKVLLYIP